MVTILVVDDDAAVAESIKSLNPSWHVIKAQSGIKALDLLRGRNDFGLIILDIHIPDIDGYDLCLCIRAALPMIPILPYTNLHDDPNLAQYMHLARCCPPVYKGTSPENLLQAIERALELRVPSIASDALAVWNRLTQKAALAEAVARQQLLTGVRVVIFGTSLLHQWALQSLVATITQTHIIATVSTLEEFRQVRVTAAVDLLIASGADYTVLAGVRQQLPIPILFIAATLGEGRALATALTSQAKHLPPIDVAVVYDSIPRSLPFIIRGLARGHQGDWKNEQARTRDVLIDAHHLLNDLPPRLAEVVILDLLGRSSHEIAQHLGVASATIGTYWKRIYQTLDKVSGVYDKTSSTPDQQWDRQGVRLWARQRLDVGERDR